MALVTSHRYYENVINATKMLQVVLGAIVIGWILYTVTQTKFEILRNNILNQSETTITANERTKQLDCLTRNIYWEAASEPFEGKVAVAQVTMNRVDAGKFGNGVCGVINQKNVVYEKVICQFSWVCETNHKTKPIYQKYWKESEEVAKKVLMENFRLPGLTDALYYHATYVSPNWKKQKVAQIGNHIFYKE
jgi:spore germination cell wall hydrolase CwlJ-like protein